MFDKLWFTKHQKTLLFFANTFIGRHILCINGNRSSVGKNKIIGISPNAIFWRTNKSSYHFVKGKKVYKQDFKAEFRTHNKFSKRIYYAFYPLWWLVHQWDTVFANNFQPNWNLGFDTLTVYPDANPESTSVDGYVRNTGATYSTVQGAADGNAADDIGTIAYTQNAYDGAGTTYYVDRAAYLFDTSALPDGATISAAIFSGFVTYYVAAAGLDSYRLITCTPASNTALGTADYDQFGATAGASDIAIGSIVDEQYNNWALNATGLTWVSLTGITKLALRSVRDISATQPGDADDTIGCYTADQTGTTNDPKLVVTYTVPGAFLAFM